MIAATRAAATAGALLVLVAVAALAATAVAAVGPGPAAAEPDDEPRPVVVVHGMMGSAAQFETLAMRLASNGWPVDRITAFEYDSLAVLLELGGATEQVRADLDDHVDAVLASTGAEQVDVVAHSLGTWIMHDWLDGSAERAGKVARYVNVDGTEGDGEPGGVPTLALWAERNPDAEVPGADNLHLLDQAHTEVVGSPESFAAIHEHLAGEPPATTAIVPADGEVSLAGRALQFPQNAGLEDAVLEVAEVNPATGRRLRDEPDHVEQLGADGAFGPFTALADRHYEYALIHPEAGTHRVYRQPSPRDNHFVRLLSSAEPGGGFAALMDYDASHMALTITRDREWWGDQGDGSDVLEIDGANVINEHTAHREHSIIGALVFDEGSDGTSDLTRPIDLAGDLPFPMGGVDAVGAAAVPAGSAGIPFITAVNLHVPAADPPQRAVRLDARPRGTDRLERVVVPDWPSRDGDRLSPVSVHFNDHHQPSTAPACPDDAVGAHPFGDVPSGSTHHEAVACAWHTRVAVGVGPDSFAPAPPVSRAQLAAMTHRVLEHRGLALPRSPAPTFDDVPAGSTHHRAVTELAAAGVVQGDGQRFDPHAPISRAQAASIVARALAWADEELAGPADPAAFDDREAIDEAHRQAVDVLADLEVVRGRADATFDPDGELRRDQTAALLARAIGLL